MTPNQSIDRNHEIKLAQYCHGHPVPLKHCGCAERSTKETVDTQLQSASLEVDVMRGTITPDYAAEIEQLRRKVRVLQERVRQVPRWIW